MASEAAANSERGLGGLKKSGNLHFMAEELPQSPGLWENTVLLYGRERTPRGPPDIVSTQKLRIIQLFFAEALLT